ncbi:MAG: phosphodiester glycosidase family protein [Clostridia bacterium]|nr:phosphodiester glycosidase family protein [Clostridia bacterium]
MNKLTQTILTLLCALMILALPLLVPSGALLESAAERIEESSVEEYEEDASLLRLFFPTAFAEEASYALPISFTPGMAPNLAGFTEDSYTDDSITVRMETRDEGHVNYCIAFVTIRDASQLRTTVAKTSSSGKPSSKGVAKISSMAQKNNAILAINADYYTNNPDKTTFEYRMGVEIRKKSNRTKDVLIIDENGDFHLYVKWSEATMSAALTELKAAGHQVINAFTFGPALVIDGQVQETDKGYSYNPNGREPRMAIGQTGPLSYVVVMAEGRGKDSDGVTHQELADYMGSLGCLQAFKLDGGNSAEMIFNNKFYGSRTGNERDQSDILYFASAVDPASWQ